MAEQLRWLLESELDVVVTVGDGRALPGAVGDPELAARGCAAGAQGDVVEWRAADDLAPAVRRATSGALEPAPPRGRCR